MLTLYRSGEGRLHRMPAGRKTLQGKTWAQLRKRWEYAHISRAVLAVAGLTAIATAVAL